MKTIDIPVEGWKDTWDNEAVNKMVSLGKEYFKDGNLIEATVLWEKASSCGNDHATFLLALLAKRNNRYKEAEHLLLRLRTRHTGLEGRIEVELADLYHRAQMPVSALGSLLMARNAGEEVCDIDKYQRAFKHTDIHASTDPHGAYILGTALIKAGIREKGVYFLSQAIQYGEGKWVASAALDLAEVAVGDDALSSEAFRIAEELGNPQILKKKRSDRHD